MVAWRICVAAVLAALLGACAQLPSDAKVKQFADAVDKTTTVYSQSIDFNQQISEKIGEERAAGNYITRRGATDEKCKKLSGLNEQKLSKLREVSFNEMTVVCGYMLPPQSAVQISAENRKMRFDLIRAIAAYGKALGEAADQGAIDKLEASVLNLGAVTATAITPILGPAAVPIVSPGAKLLSRGIGLAVGNAYAVEIRDIMKQAQKPLKEAVLILKSSIKEIRKDNRRKLARWKGGKKRNLGRLMDGALSGQNAAKSTLAEAYIQFHSAVAEARELEAKAAVLNGYEKVLDAMLQAHDALIRPEEVDAGKALAEFTKWTDDAVALLPALRENRI